MPIRLTEAAIQAALRLAVTEGRRDLSDAALPGLRVRVTPAGAASWVLACRDQHGRMRRFPLGRFPSMGVAAARTAARELHVQVRKGADPVAAARQKRAMGRDAQDGIGTLSALVEFYGAKVGSSKKSWAETRRRIEMVFKRQLSRPLVAITRMDLQVDADSYRSPQQALGALNGLRPVLKWAAGRGYADPDLTRLQASASKTQRARVLSREELATLLPVLTASVTPFAAALRFMLLTLARREEVSGAVWRDVDMGSGVWRIGAERSKNKTEHLVPLPGQALALLRSRGSGSPTALIFGTSKGGHLTNWHRATQEIMKASGTSGWTRHDLRRTGATMLGNMGELPDIIEAALNHVAIRSPLAATYNRSRYRPQVAAAFSASPTNWTPSSGGPERI